MADTPTSNPAAAPDAAAGAAASSLLGGKSTGKTAPPAELPERSMIQVACSVLCVMGMAGGLGGYALSVGDRYKNAGAALCKSNSNWLFIWGAVTLASIPMYIVMEMTRTRERVALYWVAKREGVEYTGMRAIDHILQGLSGAMSCFGLVWACIGIPVRPCFVFSLSPLIRFPPVSHT